VLLYCNAGHNPPYRIADGKVHPLDGEAGIVLGVEPSAVYRTVRAALTPDDRLFLFTDGVTEAFNVAEEAFGEARLEAALAPVVDSSAAIIEAVTAALAAFVGTASRSDDVAMLALRRAVIE
jgi:sigma-B regulation protein RsbU (phosphoserine phosphatase)